MKYVIFDVHSEAYKYLVLLQVTGIWLQLTVSLLIGFPVIKKYQVLILSCFVLVYSCYFVK